MFTPTPEQRAILDAVHTGGSVVVDACAGTGKTSTLRQVAHEVPAPKRLVYLAFNKSTQLDAARSFPSNTRATTTHALARGEVIRSRYGHLVTAKLNAGGLPRHSDTARELGIESLRVGDAKISHITLTVETQKMIDRFCDKPGTTITPDLFVPLPNYSDEVNAAIREAVTHYAQKGWANLLSETGRALKFDHRHYLKLWASGIASEDGELPRIPRTSDGDILLYDEAQDANPLMSQVVANQRHMQLIYVGDEAQAINRFMGAVNAMRTFKAEHRLALTRSWRFGPRVAEAANIFLAALQSPNRVTGNPDRDTHITDSMAADAILCRTNAAVIAEVIAEQAQGKSVAVTGGVGQALQFVRAATQLRRGQPNSHPELSMFPTWDSLVEYVDALDNPGTLGTLIKIVEQYGTDRLKKALEACVVSEDAEIIVSTAHRSKGGEWNRVRIGTDFDIDLTPASPDAHDEETLTRRDGLMLAYVSVTRGMKSVNVGSLYDAMPGRRPEVSIAADALAYEVAVARNRETNGSASPQELATEFLTRLPADLQQHARQLMASSKVAEHELLRRALASYIGLHNWG